MAYASPFQSVVDELVLLGFYEPGGATRARQSGEVTGVDSPHEASASGEAVREQGWAAFLARQADFLDRHGIRLPPIAKRSGPDGQYWIDAAGRSVLASADVRGGREIAEPMCRVLIGWLNALAADQRATWRLVMKLEGDDGYMVALPTALSAPARQQVLGQGFFAGE